MPDKSGSSRHVVKHSGQLQPSPAPDLFSYLQFIASLLCPFRGSLLLRAVLLPFSRNATVAKTGVVIWWLALDLAGLETGLRQGLWL